ncbi:MAG: rhomboid family intramembrane serine protease [Planctomycetales bacterium]|nr:rhomboid family intramembrane serine protease [Planctomycetales bacterium]NIM08110.1 rhomboid family intramembrane serine protease [Planctomycetales bacterium]NIN07605.1 rhomboid family intramembrane serine protease [Planctomycetales bacterium]NIN76727.1 rhomboid family intramembrane serine protease [Planctomycetales bacterium]NIO33916.1 rhomboid family intramembrane serine protease [Planctomycetales bacterium]
MGIYDRDYYQDTAPGMRIGGNLSMVTKLVILNAAIYLLDVLFLNEQLTHALALHSDLIRQPWRCWELVTYGFVHSPDSVIHILGNMFCLWFFGRDVEPIYGKVRFLWFYLTAIVLAGLVGGVGEGLLSGHLVKLIGASGGVSAIVILYVCHFPRRTLLIWGILPMPAWMLGVFFLLVDFLGTFRGDSNVAHTAHLAGAAYGYLFYRYQWDFSRLVPGSGGWRRLRRRPQVRIHQGDQDEDALSSEVDRILEKIGRQGESNLTASERKTLQQASRRYQQKHR